jgi:hypothetical protein
MTECICAFCIRNIRYIVDAQAFKVQQNPQQILNIRYIVDSQGLRYDIFWLPRGKIQFIVDSQAVTPSREQGSRGRDDAGL